MDFWAKLSRLAAEKGKAKVSEAAGLPATAISNYLSKRQLPRIDAALKIAQALNVPLDWLVDDDADWPPPAEAVPSSGDISDDLLMFEVAKRLRLAEKDFLRWLEAANKLDWKAVKNALEGWKEGTPLPAILQEGIAVAAGLQKSRAQAMERFNPWSFARLFHSRLTIADLPPVEAFDSIWDLNQTVLHEPTFSKLEGRLVEFASRHQRDRLFRPDSNWSLAAESNWLAPGSAPSIENLPSDANKNQPLPPKSRKKK